LLPNLRYPDEADGGSAGRSTGYQGGGAVRASNTNHGKEEENGGASYRYRLQETKKKLAKLHP